MKSPEEVSKRKKEYYQKTKDRWKLHRQSTKEVDNRRRRDRLKRDPEFKLAANLRSRLYMALKRMSLSGSAVKNLGCSISDFKIYLESLFTDGMSWSNYGEWHIDHIRALSHFDLSDPEELKKACHFKNLQPLWAVDNIIKGNK